MDKKKIPTWVIVITVIFAIGFIGILINPDETANNTLKENEQETLSDEEKNSKYLTKLEWTNSGNDNSDEVTEWLKIAIEQDNYDGDILKAGTYAVEQTDGEFDGTSQRVYNLYVTDIDTENPDEVTNNNLPITSIGNYNLSKDEIILEKGQYLYIQKVSGGKIGHIKLELK